MEQFSENDYVEHWEDGIGKIISVDEDSVVVDFIKHGGKKVPKEKTLYYNKLNPSGLLAQIYENQEHVINLIEKKSTEIIKLLIYDETKAQTGEIPRSRIKTLLTKAEPTEQGWRKDFGLIDEDDWKKWWTSVNKNLMVDTWFDTSSKSSVILREKPVSEAQNLYERFLKETQLNRKMSLCDQVIKAFEEEDQLILDDIRKFLTDLLRSDSKNDTFYPAIYNAIQLSNKEIEIEPFIKNANQQTFFLLTESKLPSQKKKSAYSFFCGLRSQDIYDHLTIFMFADKKLRKDIANKLKKKNADLLFSEDKTLNDEITENQIAVINTLQKHHQKTLYKIFADLLELECNKYVSNFLSSILISTAIQHGIKDAISRVVVEFKLTEIILFYLNNFQISKKLEIPYLSDFFSLYGSESAELSMKQTLLNENAARRRPEAFLAAFKSLLEDSIPNINANQKNSLVNHVRNLLINKLVDDDYDNLKLQADRIIADFPLTEDFKRIVADDELIKISKDRSIAINKRIDSVNLIIQKGLEKECHTIIIYLIDDLNEDDLRLFEIIFQSFPDHGFAKKFFAKMLEKADFTESKLKKALSDFLRNTDLITSFAEFIFFDQDDNTHQINYNKIINILKAEYLAKKIINFGIERIISKSEPSKKLVNRLTIYCGQFPNWTLEEMRSISMKNLFSLQSEIDKIKNNYSKERRKILQEQESHLIDSIDKASQRYEEYLIRLIPNLDDLKSIKDMIQTDIQSDNLASVIPILNNKITSVIEDIEGILKILNVIERD
jgi:hypothetical protein